MLITLGIRAQELTVKSELALEPTAMAAKIHPRYDLNGNAAAVILVDVASDKAKFPTSWKLGEVERKGGHYVVYVAPGIKKLPVEVEGCLPFEYDIKASGVKLESFRTYSLRLLLPAKERTRAIIMPQYSFGKNQGAYGLMVGFVKKHGAFPRAKSDFSFISTHGACDENGLIDGHMPWYTGKSAKKRWAVTAGYVARVAKPLYLYGGVGYGQRVLAWERQDGSYVEYQENTYKGIEAELGVMGRFGIFALSAGVQTNSFKYMEFNVGVGVMF